MSAAGVNEDSTEVSQGGIAGFFGGKERMKTYSAGEYYDPAYEKNRVVMDQMAGNANKRFFHGMGGAKVGPAAQIDMSPNSQLRNQQLRQNAMLDQFAAAANGQGPSAAQAQLKAGADRTMASNLAMAARGGTQAAMRQAAFNNAAATQDLAGQSAMLRAQEMQQARGMYADALAGARAQDASLATNQAQLNQQAMLAQAGLTQDTQKTNLLAQQDFQRQKDDLIKQYLGAGMSLDQAQSQAAIQQRQFNAGLMAQQEAAGRGVSAQNYGQSAQTVGALAQTAGAMLAMASDERAKENVSDANTDVEKFLDGIAAKSWDYKDPAKHGEGRRTGIMAQDAEKNSGMVFTHPDGTKMIDHSKAISTSLAALANINKRLRALEK